VIRYDFSTAVAAWPRPQGGGADTSASPRRIASTSRAARSGLRTAGSGVASGVSRRMTCGRWRTSAACSEARRSRSRMMAPRRYEALADAGAATGVIDRCSCGRTCDRGTALPKHQASDGTPHSGGGAASFSRRGVAHRVVKVDVRACTRRSCARFASDRSRDQLGRLLALVDGLVRSASAGESGRPSSAGWFGGADTRTRPCPRR
jgi:hypothetical protein